MHYTYYEHGYYENISLHFRFPMFFTTLSMCVYWGYKFFLDEDLSVIKYRKFHEKENDEHPTVSFCLQDPFLRQSLCGGMPGRFRVFKNSLGNS